MIVESMLSDKRQNAGLGNPPSPFYTNVPESANAVIKRTVDFKESEMSSFTLKMAQLIKRQKEDVRGALLNSGPYKLVDELSHLQLNAEKWFSMSTTQRQTHEKKFDSLELFQNEEEVQDTHPKISHLSVKPEEANLTSLPFETVKRVFQNAEALLSKENAIVSAPGSNEMAFMSALL